MVISELWGYDLVTVWKGCYIYWRGPRGLQLWSILMNGLWLQNKRKVEAIKRPPLAWITWLTEEAVRPAKFNKSHASTVLVSLLKKQTKVDVLGGKEKRYSLSYTVINVYMHGLCHLHKAPNSYRIPMVEWKSGKKHNWNLCLIWSSS